MAFEEECFQEEDVVPFAYQLADEPVPCGYVREDEEIRYSPQNRAVTLNYQEPGRIIEAYPVQCSEPVFECSQESAEATVLVSKLGDVEMEEAMQTEQTIQEDESSFEAKIESIQKPVRGFVLAPDLFGD